MAQSIAEKVTQIEDGKNLVKFGKALVEFDIREQVISDLEDAIKLEITDTYSEKVVRKHRQNAKSLEVRIEKRRLELNREFKEKTDTAAGLIAPRVTAVYIALDEKIKAVEAKRAAEKAEKERQESERLATIQAKLDMLNHLAGKPMEYNRLAEDIARDLAHIEAFEISDIDFQECQREAELIKSGAIITAKNALESRRKFEADQAEAARVKAEQKAEAQRLEEERAKLEEEKAAVAKAKVIAEREAVMEVAHQENFDRDHEAALVEYDRYKADLQAEMDQARADAKARWEQTEHAKAEAVAREKLVGPDRVMITTIATDLQTLIEKYDIPRLNTDEANELVRDMITGINTRIDLFEQAGKALV